MAGSPQRLSARGYYDPLLGYDVSHILPRHVGSRVISLEEGDECWRPACDVYETDDALVVHVDLPGVPKSEINLDVRGNALYVYGKHQGRGLGLFGLDLYYLKSTGIEGFEAAASQVRERHIGKFRKIVRLPDEVDHDVSHAKAMYKDGLLSVEIPKSRENVGHRIAIE